jgi:hypothetical protein
MSANVTAALRRWLLSMRAPVMSWRERRARHVDSPNGDATAYVRASPECILVEERLVYDQVISGNPSSSLSQPPSGRIRICVPYDGGSCFGTDAREDAEKILRFDDDPGEAVIGHLVFVEHEETDLDEVLGLEGTFGPYPVRIPIRSSHLNGAEALTADRFQYHCDISYRPPAGGPEIVPLQVLVRLFDPGHGDGAFMEERNIAKLGNDSVLRRRVCEKIKESAEFEPHLAARIDVRLSLPPRRLTGRKISEPVVRNVRVTLPDGVTLPPSSVRLYSSPDDRASDQRLQIDTPAGSFDWPGEPMSVGASADDAPRVFLSKPVEVHFLQPGELFRQREVRVDVDVELPDELTSGALVRFFGATGEAPRRGAANPLKVRTIISARCTVLLYDAFSKRRIAPSQSFCFDEIVPDEQRVADVEAELVDQGFSLPLKEPLDGNGKKRIERLIIAERRDGPRTMQLWIYVDGRRHPTKRESRHPWGHRYRSKFESGTLNVHIRGLVHGDARGVTREINALHLALHERFQRMKALR